MSDQLDSNIRVCLAIFFKKVRNDKRQASAESFKRVCFGDQTFKIRALRDPDLCLVVPSCAYDDNSHALLRAYRGEIAYFHMIRKRV
jgi:hypothetical protein